MVQLLPHMGSRKIAGLNRDELKHALREMVIRDLRLQGVKPEEVGDDLPLTGARLGFDSIDILELLVAIERRFRVRIRDGDEAARAFGSINALADFLLENAPQSRP